MKWYDRPAHVKNLYPFGCLGYVKLIVNGKLEQQAAPMIHLGRARDQPGYVMYDPATNRIHVSPMVRMLRREFPGLRVVNGREVVIPSFSQKFDNNLPRPAEAAKFGPLDFLDEDGLDPALRDEPVHRRTRMAECKLQRRPPHALRGRHLRSTAPRVPPFCQR